MASKHLPLLLLLLLTLLSSLHIHARDSQMFNKVPSKTNEVVAKNPTKEIPNKEDPLDSKEQEPNSIPENENSYGLYGHESGQLPPSTTTPTNEPFKTTSNFPYNAKYLPKNYNPVAYVTEPEDFNDSSFTNKENNYYDRSNNYYNGHQQGEKDFEFMNKEDTVKDNKNNYYNNGGNNYDEQQEGNYYTNGGNNYNAQREGLSGTSFMDTGYTTRPAASNYDYTSGVSGRVNRVQPQGMSDTRFLENGRYFYDVNAENYSRDQYENSMVRNQYNPRGYNGNNNENSYQYNNYNEGQEQYQDEENLP